MNKVPTHVRNFWLRNRKPIIAILFIVTAFAGYLFYDRMNPPVAETTVDPVAEAKKDTEAKLDELNLVFSNVTFTSKDAQLKRLGTASRLVDEILASDNVDEDDRNVIEYKALDIKGEHAMTALSYQSANADELESHWIDFAQQTMNSPIEANASRAHSNLCAYYIISFIHDSSAARFSRLQQQLRTSLPLLLEKQHDLGRLTSQIVGLGAKVESERETVPGFLIEVGDMYKATGNRTDWLYGSSIHDQLVLRGRDIDSACTKVEINAKEEIATVQSYMQEVTEAQIPSERLYSLVFSGLEAFSRLNSSTDLTGAVKEIQSSIQKIESPAVKEKVSQQLDNYLLRTSGLIGQSIDFTFLDSNPNFNQGDKVFSEGIAGKKVVIFFGDNSERANNLGQALVAFRARNTVDKDEEYVYIEMSEKDFNQVIAPTKPIDKMSFFNLVRGSLGKTHVLRGGGEAKLLKQIPVEHAPFVVVLDSQHRVSITNAQPAFLAKYLQDAE
jgi:hypothetical protein